MPETQALVPGGLHAFVRCYRSTGRDSTTNVFATATFISSVVSPDFCLPDGLPPLLSQSSGPKRPAFPVENHELAVVLHPGNVWGGGGAVISEGDDALELPSVSGPAIASGLG